ncbi:MAG: hypothetical protein JRD89_01090 [Deltaproteobacteria bacterium]|nr:hypothetical protein [Deltaproteobacteria bacterium]
MRYRTELQMVVPVVLVLVVVIILVLIGDYLGFAGTFTTDFVSVLPGLVVFVVGAGSLVVVGSTSFAIAGFAVMGIGLCILIDEMNTAGILIPDILTSTFTLDKLQLTILIFFIIIGAIAAVRK